LEKKPERTTNESILEELKKQNQVLLGLKDQIEQVVQAITANQKLIEKSYCKINR